MGGSRDLNLPCAGQYEAIMESGQLNLECEGQAKAVGDPDLQQWDRDIDSSEIQDMEFLIHGRWLVSNLFL